MDDHRTSDSPLIAYSLRSRLLMSGQVAVVLQLYRSDTIALTSTLMVCDREQTAASLRLCRTHLLKLGVHEIDARPQRSTRPNPSASRAA